MLQFEPGKAPITLTAAAVERAKYLIEKSEDKINVFTTRPDTIFGASFICLSADHPLNKNFLEREDFKKFKQLCDKTGTT